MINSKNKKIEISEDLKKVYNLKLELLRILCRASCADELNLNFNVLRAGICAMIMSSMHKKGWDEAIDDFAESCKHVLKEADSGEMADKMDDVKNSLLKLMETLREKMGDELND